MPFTGGLGTPDSGLSQIGLGTVSTGSGRTTQSLQLKANIFGTATQSLQMKARIAQPIQTIDLKARIRGVQSFQAKARMVGFLQSRLEVDFNILVTLHQRLTVTYNVGDKQMSFRSFQAKASILKPAQTRLAVEYAVCYTTPTLPVVRPTQRTNVRVVQSLLTRARIKAP